MIALVLIIGFTFMKNANNPNPDNGPTTQNPSSENPPIPPSPPGTSNEDANQPILNSDLNSVSTSAESISTADFSDNSLDDLG